MSDAKLFLGLLMFFGIWTGFVGIANMSASGEISMSDMSALAGPIPGQVSPNIGGINFGINNETNLQDFTLTEGYSSDITIVEMGILGFFFPTWTQEDGVGYVSQQDVLQTSILGSRPTEIYLRGSKPVNGVYVTAYNIANPNPSQEFYTQVYRLGSGAGYYVRYNLDGIALYHISEVGYGFDITPVSTAAFPNANNGKEYRTEYNPGQGTVSVVIDGMNAGTLTGIPPIGASQYTSDTSFAGVATYHAGLIVQSIYGVFQTPLGKTTDIGTTIWNFFKTVWEALNAFWSLISAAIGLSSSPVVPAGVWAVVGLPCIATLIYLGLKLARGGG